MSSGHCHQQEAGPTQVTLAPVQPHLTQVLPCAVSPHVSLAARLPHQTGNITTSPSYGSQEVFPPKAYSSNPETGKLLFVLSNVFFFLVICPIAATLWEKRLSVVSEFKEQTAASQNR
ncbi:hypothetical protein BaRGS_00018526 [Batillaria attramentaria]|uniref:Uncharacterized protein n=1 Tax=Batillaria attramentaria TaxID=370345 RepID=A0ABD0KSE5_9CAEN